VWWAGAMGAWGVWAVLWGRRWERAGAAALLLAVATTSASWHHCCWFLFGNDDLGRFARTEEQPACVEVVALKSVQEVPRPPLDPMRALPLGDRARFEAEVVAIRDGARWVPASGRTQVEVFGRLSGIDAGDRLRIFGELAAPQSPQNPGEFDYATYLRGQRVGARIAVGFSRCVEVLAPGDFSPRRLIEQTRSAGNRTLQRHIDHRRSPLAAAVLLGIRDRFDPDEKRAFMETGTVHLLAISGLHVGILAGTLLWLVQRLPLPRSPGLALVAAATVCYMLITDARPPVIRATILVLMICWSLWLGRRGLSFNSLAAAALIVLVVNPVQVFQVGAQLSFLAVAALMWFGPLWLGSPGEEDPLKRLIRENRPWPVGAGAWIGRHVWQLVLISAIIWLIALPLVMARFHLLTPIALVLNPLLWLPMSLALMSGFATLVFGSWSAASGQVFGGCCDRLLGVLQWGVAHGQEISWGHCRVPGPADWWLIGFYGAMALVVAFPRIRPPLRWCVALAAVWVAVGVTASESRRQTERLDCTFLSMGHGCAVLLELPSGETILYDAGRFSSPATATQSISAALISRGVTHLDAVILSHADIDHYNALPGLFEQGISIGVVYVSPKMWQEQNAALDALREAIDRSGVPLKEIYANDRLPGGRRCEIRVLHPPKKGSLGEDNANSIVLVVEYLGRRILLTGDIGTPGYGGSTPGLNAILAEEPLDCDVLLAPHHGSRGNNTPELAAWSTPDWVIISGSRRWDPEPIREVYGAVGSRVLHTADTGAVHVTIDADGVRVEEFVTP